MKKRSFWPLKLLLAASILMCPANGTGSQAMDYDDTILLCGKSAAVKLYHGSSIWGNTNVVHDALGVKILHPLQNAFNRYRLVYSASAPVQGTITYSAGGSTHVEDFYLEAGVRKTFSSFIDGFLNGTKGTQLDYLSFYPKVEDGCVFRLDEMDLDTTDVSGGVTYIENARFKIGADLSWGGGLCYIEDKQNEDAGLKNLLNRCDAGRLVQQSYYGTMSEPYKCASYNGSTWSYNPVQGGDQHGNKSKIVDFQVKGDSIYVKCRPMDWAQNGSLTPSYMENTYTLEDDYIRVDNRFTDYSNYNHRMAHQELPAFYVVSYLDQFTFYDGSNPWSEDRLTVKKDLNFWGDPQYSQDCYFPVRQGNTETWCSWTSQETGYGIGLYTPNVEILLAGRFSYNGSKDPTNGATNYVAPLCTMSLSSFEPQEYSYLITTGDVSEIRETFTSHKDFQSNASLKESSKANLDLSRMSFDRQIYMAAWDSPVNNVPVRYTGFGVKLEPDGYIEDPHVYINYDITDRKLYTSQYRYLVISYYVPETAVQDTYDTEIFVCTGKNTSAAAGKSFHISLERQMTNRYITQIIDLRQFPSLWPSSGNVPIHGFRLDYASTCEVWDSLYISEFSLAGTYEEAKDIADSSAAGTPFLNLDLSDVPRTDRIPGDVNQDGIVDGADSALLLQKLAEWDVEVDQNAADVNKDGVVDGADSTLLLQKLAEWDVDLK